MIVAEAYRKELDGRQVDFDVVAFAVYYTGYRPKTNYETFANVFGTADSLRGWSVEFDAPDIPPRFPHIGHASAVVAVRASTPKQQSDNKVRGSLAGSTCSSQCSLTVHLET